MQKIAYSTLAVSVPLILTGCDDDDVQQEQEPVECGAITSATDCEAAGECNWDVLDSEEPSCGLVEEFRTTLKDASLSECGDLDAVISQSCEVPAGSTCASRTTWEFLGDQDDERQSAKLSFADAQRLLAAEETFEVRFHKPATGDFDAETGNLTDICKGFLNGDGNSDTVEICAAADCNQGASFECNIYGQDAVAELPDGTVLTGNMTPTQGQWDTNIVYAAQYYDACLAAAECGMELTDGNCIEVQEFCAQPLFQTPDACPTEYIKANVAFVTVGDNSVRSASQVCQGVGNEPIFLDDKDGNPTEEPALDADGNPMFTEFSCQNVDDLEFVTCAATPYPSRGCLGPNDFECQDVPNQPDMCSDYLADADSFDLAPRRIQECQPLVDSVDVSYFNGQCVDLATMTATEANPVDGERNCESSGTASIQGAVKECALPRNFSCGEFVAADADAETEETCENSSSQAICARDNGDRFMCRDVQNGKVGA